MAIYAIGDIQGCYQTLQALLKSIDFNPSQDQLWCTGDLVNRGPDSLAVLRWAMELEGAVTVVLGNHELHLLACGLGVVEPQAKDTLAQILKAPDRDQLIQWLRQQPLFFRHGNKAMVHAALHPSWSLDDTETIAHDLSSMLQTKDAEPLLRASYGQQPSAWLPDEPVAARRLAALAILTRLRCLTPSGHLTFDYHGGLDTLPDDRVPWWRVKGRRSASETIYCGHWAAIGLHREAGIVALDSGCVWGRSLTACRLEDGAIFQVSAQDPL